MKKLQKGFTIVELLIVIVVIGILAALVLNAFSGAQAKARDAQRATDIKAMASQLEVYFLNNGSVYPGTGGMTQAFWDGTPGFDHNGYGEPSDNTAYSVTNATAITTPTANFPTDPTGVATLPSSTVHKFVYVPYNGTGAAATLCAASCAHFAFYYYTENTPSTGVQLKKSLN